ncbi:Proteasome Subunit Alpha-Type 8 [Manis pentadactyla]|nr:Proteasome Subunit Alpha-Type 8 [Manis pentadactyla]
MLVTMAERALYGRMAVIIEFAQLAKKQGSTSLTLRGGNGSPCSSSGLYLWKPKGDGHLVQLSASVGMQLRSTTDSGTKLMALTRTYG